MFSGLPPPLAAFVVWRRRKRKETIALKHMRQFVAILDFYIFFLFVPIPVEAIADLLVQSATCSLLDGREDTFDTPKRGKKGSDRIYT